MFDCRMLAGIFAAARQGIEPAPHHGSSVLSARGFEQRALLCFSVGLAHHDAGNVQVPSALPQL